MMGCVFDSPNWATNDLSMPQLSTGQGRNILSWVIISYVFLSGFSDIYKVHFSKKFLLFTNLNSRKIVPICSWFICTHSSKRSFLYNLVNVYRGFWVFFISSCKPFCLEAGNGHLPVGGELPNSHVLFRKQRTKNYIPHFWNTFAP